MLLWRRRLELLLDGSGPRMVFQPIWRLADMQRIGWEALARFPTSEDVRAVLADEDRVGLIGLLDDAGDGFAPAVWFSAAADEGRTIDLELRCVAAALDELPRVPAGEYLSVNVGPDTALSERLVSALCPYRDHLDRVVLELTEHNAIADYGAFRRRIEDLRAFRGAACVRVPGFAADDVGAGHSSLQHILELRTYLDLVKLDMSLVRGIEANAMLRELVRGIVAGGHQEHYRVVAEGARPEQVPILRSLGVHAAQGFDLPTPGAGRPGPLPPT